MNLQDLKEQILQEAKNNWDRFRESSLFIQAKEKFESLSPSTQKTVTIGLAAIVTFFVVSVPLGNWMQSQDQIAEFEEKRDLIRQVFTLAQESQNTPPLPQPPSEDLFRTQIKQNLEQNQIAETQLRGIANSTVPVGDLHPNWISEIFDVEVTDLNIRQLVNFGQSIQRISPSLRLQDLDVKASQEAGYFNVIYRIAFLKVPEVQMQAPEEKSAPNAKKGKL